MDRPKGLSFREVFVSVVLAAALVAAVFPGVIFGGASIFSTDAIFAVEPWASEMPAEKTAGKPHNGELGDHDFQFFPLLVEIQRQIHEGERAVWTPYAYAGAPLAANVQLALHDPFHLLLPFFQERDFLFGEGRGAFSIAAVSRGLSITGLLRLLLCLVFAYLWLRRVGAGIAPAALGALLLGLGPYPSLWRLHTPEQVYSLWPLALFFLEGMLRRGGFGSFAGFTLGLAASQLGGYPQTSLFFALFCLAYVVLRAEPERRRARLVDLAIAGVASALICAPTWLPWLSYASESVFKLQREELPWIPLHACFGTAQVAGFVAAGLGAAGLLAAALFARVSPVLRGALAALACALAWIGGGDGEALLWLFPELRGDPVAGGVLRPPPGRAFLEVVQDHVGLLLAWLVLAGAARGMLRALALVLVAGSTWPFVEQGLRAAVPWLAPSRAASLVPILLALALVFALRNLALLPRDERRARLAAAALGLLAFVAVSVAAGLVLRALHGSEAFAVQGVAWTSVASALALAAVAFAPSAAGFAARPAAATCIASGGVLLSVALAWGFQPRIASEDVYPRTKTIDFLLEACAKDVDARVFSVAGDAFRGNALQTYRIPDVFAADGIEPRGVVELFNYLNYPEILPPRGSFRACELAMLRTPLFDLLGARYVVMRRGDAMPGHFRVVHEAARLVVAENPRAAPRAWLTSERYDPDADPEAIVRKAITEHVGLRAEVPELEGARMREGSVRVREREPGALVLDVDCDGSAWLVVRDTLLPGWSATIEPRGEDDAAEPKAQRLGIAKAFGAFRAVRVPAGAHRVEFRYQPLGWPRVQLLALLVVMLLGLGAAVLVFFRMTVWPFLAVQDVKRKYRSARGG